MQTFDLLTGYNIELRIKVNRRWAELEELHKRPMTEEDIVLWSAQRLVQQRREIDALKRENEIQNNRILEVESKIITKDTNYYTISGYAHLMSRSVDKSVAQSLGKQASQICKNREVKTGKEYDAKYGQIKTYPANILKEVFENYFKN